MSLDNWFRWPTNSSDPALNAAIAVLLAMTALMVLAGFVAFAVIIAIPAGILFAAAHPEAPGPVRVVVMR